MSRYLYSFLLPVVAFLFSACGAKNKQISPDDTPVSGTINISVDESFRPVIEEQIRVYESSFPGTHIIASYKTEADCLKDFFRNPKTRMVIVTRGLSATEEGFLRDSFNYLPAWNAIASDAIAVIVNSKSTDTLFELKRLQQQLSGKINRNQTIVFDGLNATSTVRFISDSILKGDQFDTSVVKAVKTSSDVINYVSRHENAIGLTGISWVGNPEDSSQVNSLRNVKIAYVQCGQCTDSPYVKPMQASIMTHRYPLVRALYYVLNENYQGLGNGFISFLRYERGQLIFRRAYLSPVMDFRIRNVKINQSLPGK